MWRITVASLAAHKRRLLATVSAVALGVAFLFGTLVLTRTVSSGFSSLLADAYAGTDAVVRSSLEVGGEITERALLDSSLTETIASVDGVSAAAPRITSEGRIVGADGDPIGGDGQTIAGNWIVDDRLNPYALAEGRAPGRRARSSSIAPRPKKVTSRSATGPWSGRPTPST